MTTTNTYCSTKVWETAMRWHRCPHMAVIERDGKGYCKQHDPKAKAEKRRVQQAFLDIERERISAERNAAILAHQAAQALLERKAAAWDQIALESRIYAGDERLLDLIIILRKEFEEAQP